TATGGPPRASGTIISQATRPGTMAIDRGIVPLLGDLDSGLPGGFTKMPLPAASISPTEHKCPAFQYGGVTGLYLSSIVWPRRRRSINACVKALIVARLTR